MAQRPNAKLLARRRIRPVAGSVGSLTFAAARLRTPKAWTTWSGIRSLGPPILKFCRDRCVWAPQYLNIELLAASTLKRPMMRAAFSSSFTCLRAPRGVRNCPSLFLWMLWHRAWQRLAVCWRSARQPLLNSAHMAATSGLRCAQERKHWVDVAAWPSPLDSCPRRKSQSQASSRAHLLLLPMRPDLDLQCGRRRQIIALSAAVCDAPCWLALSAQQTSLDR